jgi:nitric oxide reductase NorE protein
LSALASPAANQSPGPSTHLPGEEGTWVFILGDMSVFAVFFATYLYYRTQDPTLFRASQRTLHQSYGAINTLLLLTSSLFVVTGVRAIRRQLRVAPRLFVGAFACGLGFCLLKVLEYHDKIAHNQTPSTNSFYLYFFILTGVHLFHLLIGMGLLVFLWLQSRRTAHTPQQIAFIEGGASFWHMVDLLWIVLFPLLYLAR